MKSLRRWEFQELHTLDERSDLARHMRRRQPGNVPLVVGRAARCRVGTHTELRVSVPSHLSIGELCLALRARLEVHPAHSLIYFVGSTVVTPSCSLASLYHQHADKDRFLYIAFTEENALG